MQNKPDAQTRMNVYDWLRGCASVAVVLGHIKPVPKEFAVWSVNLFVMITMALVSKKGYVFGRDKLFRRVAYLAYVYVFCVVLFLGLFSMAGLFRDIQFARLLLDPRIIFIDNPYFGHLWYLLLYLQVLIFLFVSLKTIQTLRPLWVVMATAVFSEAVFFVTHTFDRFNSILVFSWLFYMALGYYFVPPYLRFIKERSDLAGWRAAGFLMLTAIVFSQTLRFPWLFISENRPTILFAPICLLVLFTLADSFYCVERMRLEPVKNFFSFAGRYTLIVYVAHMGFVNLLKEYVSEKWTLTIATVSLSLVLGYCVHHSFLFLEKVFLEKSDTAR